MKHSTKKNYNISSNWFYFLTGFLLLVLILGVYFNNPTKEGFDRRDVLPNIIIEGTCDKCPVECTSSCTYNDQNNTSMCVAYSPDHPKACKSWPIREPLKDIIVKGYCENCPEHITKSCKYDWDKNVAVCKAYPPSSPKYGYQW